MKLFAFLFSRSPRESDPPPPVNLPPAVFTPPDPEALRLDDPSEAIPDDQTAAPVLTPAARPWPAEDGRRSAAELNAARGIVDLGDAYCVIEYRDAAGRPSRRRVTMQSLRPGPHAPMLYCVCHERRAFRMFRLDRVSGVIDDDGQVIAPREFFLDLYGQEVVGLLDRVPPQLQAARIRPEQRRPVETRSGLPKPGLLEEIRPALFILVAVAKADREYHGLEIDAIEAYAETEAALLSREGVISPDFGPELYGQIAAQVKVMRPQARTLQRHVETVSSWSVERLQRLARAIQKVAGADGRFLASEANLIEEVRQMSVGRIGAGPRG